MLDEFGVKQHSATTLFKDNQGAMCIAKNSVVRSKTNQIDVRYHFIRKGVRDGVIKLQYCPTETIVADALTKALPTTRFMNLHAKMGLRN